MKITEITISQKIQAKQYEPVELSMTSTIDEGEDINQAIDDLRKYIDYKLRKESRDAQYEKFEKELQTEIGEKRVEEIQAWMNKYHELEEEITKIEFK